MALSYYPLLLIAGLAISLVIWMPRVRRDPRLLTIFGASVLGAFAGAKVVYLAAEGFLYWENPQRWLMWATGKTILGALIGGYVAVECAKKAVGYRAPTGDLFAMAASIGIILGRVGCLLHGCCPGAVCDARWWTLADANEVARWPTVPIEIAFNVLAFEGCLILRRRALLPGQHFHLYLIGYGLFRFVHEFVRDTPRVLGGFSGYHFAAVAVAVLGTTGFMLRQAATNNQAVR